MAISKYDFTTASSALSLCEKYGIGFAELTLRREEELQEKAVSEIRRAMKNRLGVMREAIASGFAKRERTISGLSGGDADKLLRNKRADNLLGEALYKAINYSFAILETNAGFGRIVAYPTAGSAGTVPGSLLAASEVLLGTEEHLISAMFASAGIGLIIAENAMLAGATGGCQAEVGSASAMAAGALVELRGGSPTQVFSAAAIALKGLLGLVCDPVAGLVECPCIKRNATAISNAFMASEIVLAGVESNIPFDEVVVAMKRIGENMHPSLRETAEGGIATTPTGLKVWDKIK
jgi:L-serine dehydratase